MAKEVYPEAEELRVILKGLKNQLMHRASRAWDRGPETFGDEIAALNDVFEALRDLG